MVRRRRSDFVRDGYGEELVCFPANVMRLLCNHYVCAIVCMISQITHKTTTELHHVRITD